MFVVTPAGVIATDPISYGRPQADHIAGGKPFKDAGATVIAHRRAKERLAELKGLDVVVPDQAVEGRRRPISTKSGRSLTELSAEVKKAADAGKCFDPATKEVRLPQYATLQNYEQNVEWNIHRWCGYWGRGI
jgi:hypothetical protein